MSFDAIKRGVFSNELSELIEQQKSMFAFYANKFNVLYDAMILDKGHIKSCISQFRLINLEKHLNELIQKNSYIGEALTEFSETAREAKDRKQKQQEEQQQSGVIFKEDNQFNAKEEQKKQKERLSVLLKVPFFGYQEIQPKNNNRVVPAVPSYIPQMKNGRFRPQIENKAEEKLLEKEENSMELLNHQISTFQILNFEEIPLFTQNFRRKSSGEFTLKMLQQLRQEKRLNMKSEQKQYPPIISDSSLSSLKLKPLRTLGEKDIQSKQIIDLQMVDEKEGFYPSNQEKHLRLQESISSLPKINHANLYGQIENQQQFQEKTGGGGKLSLTFKKAQGRYSIISQAEANNQGQEQLNYQNELLNQETMMKSLCSLEGESTQFGNKNERDYFQTDPKFGMSLRNSRCDLNQKKTILNHHADNNASKSQDEKSLYFKNKQEVVNQYLDNNCVSRSFIKQLQILKNSKNNKYQVAQQQQQQPPPPEQSPNQIKLQFIERQKQKQIQVQHLNRLHQQNNISSYKPDQHPQSFKKNTIIINDDSLVENQSKYQSNCQKKNKVKSSNTTERPNSHRSYHQHNEIKYEFQNEIQAGSKDLENQQQENNLFISDILVIKDQDFHSPPKLKQYFAPKITSICSNNNNQPIFKITPRKHKILDNSNNNNNNINTNNHNINNNNNNNINNNNSNNDQDKKHFIEYEGIMFVRGDSNQMQQLSSNSRKEDHHNGKFNLSPLCASKQIGNCQRKAKNQSLLETILGKNEKSNNNNNNNNNSNSKKEEEQQNQPKLNKVKILKKVENEQKQIEGNIEKQRETIKFDPPQEKSSALLKRLEIYQRKNHKKKEFRLQPNSVNGNNSAGEINLIKNERNNERNHNNRNKSNNPIDINLHAYNQLPPISSKELDNTPSSKITLEIKPSHDRKSKSQVEGKKKQYLEGKLFPQESIYQQNSMYVQPKQDVDGSSMSKNSNNLHKYLVKQSPLLIKSNFINNYHQKGFHSTQNSNLQTPNPNYLGSSSSSSVNSTLPQFLPSGGNWSKIITQLIPGLINYENSLII